MKIEKLWAFVYAEEDGSEGLIAMKVGDDWMTFITGSESVRDLLESKIPSYIKTTKPQIKILEFSNRMELKTL